MKSVRQQFPALEQEINGNPLVYLDSAASSLKPKRVVDRLSKYYSLESSNVHRGAHHLSNLSTSLYEESRQKVADFIKASSANEIVFTRGTTESINLVAQSFALPLMKKGGAILLTDMEHHSNLVPWQMVAQQTGCELRFIPTNKNGDLDLSSLDSLLDHQVKMVSVVHCSNTLGTLNPVDKIIARAREVGAIVLVDAAQSVLAVEIDIKKLDADFLCFSGHKIFAPFGIGVLFGKEALLNEMQPYQTGGSMIREVALHETSFLSSPQRFEAGTPNVGGAVALGEAIDFINEIGQGEIYQHEKLLTDRLRGRLEECGGINFFGSSDSQFSLVTFNVEGIHPGDLGQLLNEYGVAVRTGMHCTQPLLEKFNLSSSLRASFSVYNSEDDVDKFVDCLIKSKGMLV